MSDPILTRLGALSKSLNDTSDIISNEIAALESALNALRLGVPAWVEVERESVYEEFEDSQTKKKTLSEFTRVLMLGYGKHSGNWGLLTCEFYEELGEEGPNVRLVSARREVKMAAIEKIPELLTAIEKRATTITGQVKATAGKLTKITSELRQQSQTRGGNPAAS